MFLDQAVIEVEAGDGGDGASAFRREAKVPHGGPSGGDGGRGGDVIVRADPALSTLVDFRYRTRYRAGRGDHGSGGRRTGKDGETLVLGVPPGTVVREVGTDIAMGEVVRPGEELVVARGGGGGRGNARFATPTDRAPRRRERGRPGEVRQIELELKLIADVGLVGEPNAGKSTFLAAVSAASPRVADYPFTTITPNLGVVSLEGGRSFVVADIPGIIEGAHAGKGLGHRFLRHIERTRTLALLVPADDLDPEETYHRLRDELARYSEALAAKPFCMVLTKADLLPAAWEVPPVGEGEAWGRFVVSSVARTGLSSLLEALWEVVERERAGEDAPAPEEEEAWRP